MEGVDDPPLGVNTRLDVSGRTLLAWYGMEIAVFHARLTARSERSSIIRPCGVPNNDEY